MIIATHRNALLPALAAATTAVDSRATIPILANVLITAAGGRVHLTATNLDMVVTTSIVADCNLAGSVTLPGRMLHQILAKLPDGAAVSLTLDPATSRVTVAAGRARFQLPTLPAADFPSISGPDDTAHHFTLPGDRLAALLARPTFAMSREETRYYLQGVYLHALSDHLAAVATDGHRLARTCLPLPDGAAGLPAVIVPRDTVMTVLKLKPEGDVAIAVSATKVSFAWGDTRIVTKLIDGTYPDYERVIPRADQPVTANVDRKAMAASLDRVMAVSTEKTRAVKLTIGAGITISATGADQGQAEDQLDLANHNGPQLEIGFNGKYLLEALDALAGDTIRFHGDSAGSPALLTDPDSQDILVVVMPMRV